MSGLQLPGKIRFPIPGHKPARVTVRDRRAEWLRKDIDRREDLSVVQKIVKSCYEIRVRGYENGKTEN